MRALHQIRDPQEQCRDLLAQLHASENPVTYIKLYDAIKDEPHLQWLIDRIDACSDHSEQQRQATRQVNVSPFRRSNVTSFKS